MIREEHLVVFGIVVLAFTGIAAFFYIFGPVADNGSTDVSYSADTESSNITFMQPMTEVCVDGSCETYQQAPSPELETIVRTNENATLHTYDYVVYENGSVGLYDNGTVTMLNSWQNRADENADNSETEKGGPE